MTVFLASNSRRPHIFIIHRIEFWFEFQNHFNNFVVWFWSVMNICKHLKWLQIVNEKKLALINSNHMKRIVEQLTNSMIQQSSVLFFIERAVKIRAFWKLFLNHIKQNCIDDLITFQINNISFYSNHFVFFVDNNASTMIAITEKTFCHKIESFFIHWMNVIIVHDVYDILHAHIFDIFSDVFCIFADDFLNLDSVVNRLKCWIVVEKTSNLFQLNIIIIKIDNEFHVNFMFSLFEMQNVWFILNQKILKNFYSSITMLYLFDEYVLSLTWFQWLKEFSWKQMNKMRNIRLCCWHFYLIMHLNKFFQLTVSQTAYFILRSFDFVLVSWIDNEINWNHIDHFILIL